MRVDSALFGHQAIAALKSAPDVSVTVRLHSKRKTAISSIPVDVWTTI